MSLPLGPLSQIIGTLSTIEYSAPGPDPDPNANPVEQRYDLSPAVVARTKTLQLYGANFGGSDTVLLLEPGESDVDITSWTDPLFSTASKRVIAIPDPGPDPGIYQLRIQSGTHLSNSTPSASPRT
jgi:hypothetical protein